MFPKISVVLPVYNGENFLQKALESILSQDYSNYEILVGINPSTDSTVKVAKSMLGSKYPGILEFKETVSMPQNLNRTASNAVGKYIKFLCHDDELHPNALGLLVREFEQNSNHVLVTSYESFLGKERGSRGFESFGPRRVVGQIRSLYRFSRYANWIGGPSGVMVRTDLFRDIMFDEKFACAFDLDCWIQLSRRGTIAVVPRELYFSRIHPDQGSHFCSKGGFSSDLSKIRKKCLSSSDVILKSTFRVLG
jgi:glycosyltransferase involved in cell wall biosynthesis